jgi:hypothetical protein
MQPLVSERRWGLGLVGVMSLAVVVAAVCFWPQHEPAPPVHREMRGESIVQQVRVTVCTDPDGALVETAKDGKIGRTPLVFLAEPNVELDLRVRLDGFFTAEHTLTPVADTELDVSLERLPRVRKAHKSSGGGGCCPTATGVDCLICLSL